MKPKMTTLDIEVMKNISMVKKRGTRYILVRQTVEKLGSLR